MQSVFDLPSDRDTFRHKIQNIGRCSLSLCVSLRGSSVFWLSRLSEVQETNERFSRNNLSNGSVDSASRKDVSLGRLLLLRLLVRFGEHTGL